MKKFVVSFAVLLLTLVGLSVVAGPGKLLVGAGRVEIKPPAEAALAGYGGRGMGNLYTGIHDPVYARALIFEAGGKRVAFVNSDTLQVLREIRVELADRVKDLKIDYLALAATHTHNSMGSYVDNFMVEIAVMGKYRPEARAALLTALEATMRQAAGQMKPAKIGAGVGPCTGIGGNRRHEGGPVDETIRVFGVWGEDGKLMAAVMNHGIHPTTMGQDNLKLSGDNAGRAEATLEGRYPGAIALFMNSGLGDQGAGGKQFDMGDDWARVAGIGDAMADAADAVLKSITPTDQVEMAIYRRTFAMPPVNLRWAYECFAGLSPIMKEVGKDLQRTEGEVSAVGLNNAFFLFSSGEITLGEQQAIEKAAPAGTIPIVVAHANDWYGYVLTPEDYDTGGYESCMNLYGRDFGNQFPTEFKRMVEAGPVK